MTRSLLKLFTACFLRLNIALSNKARLNNSLLYQPIMPLHLIAEVVEGGIMAQLYLQRSWSRGRYGQNGRHNSNSSRSHNTGCVASLVILLKSYHDLISPIKALEK
ncbi:hypothetical protein AAG906_037157 [Vitis piasezkii]